MKLYTVVTHCLQMCMKEYGLNIIVLQSGVSPSEVTHSSSCHCFWKATVSNVGRTLVSCSRVVSSPGRVKTKAMKLVVVASPLSTGH
jgi:hypothetical protein